MAIEDKILEKELKLINDKLDYANEILDALVNTTIGYPPNDIPEVPIKENEYEALGNAESNSELSPMAIDPGAIRPCKYRYVYIWLTNGTSFWAWLTYVGKKSVSGFKWTGDKWVYFGTDLRRIDSFICE